MQKRLCLDFHYYLEPSMVSKINLLSLKDDVVKVELSLYTEDLKNNKFHEEFGVMDMYCILLTHPNWIFENLEVMTEVILVGSKANYLYMDNKYKTKSKRFTILVEGESESPEDFVHPVGGREYYIKHEYKERLAKQIEHAKEQVTHYQGLVDTYMKRWESVKL